MPTFGPSAGLSAEHCRPMAGNVQQKGSFGSFCVLFCAPICGHVMPRRGWQQLDVPSGWVRVLRAVAGSEREEAGQSSEEQVASRADHPFSAGSGSCHFLDHRVVCQRLKQKPPRRFGGWMLQCRLSGRDTPTSNPRGSIRGRVPRKLESGQAAGKNSLQGPPKRRRFVRKKLRRASAVWSSWKVKPKYVQVKLMPRSRFQWVFCRRRST